MHTAAPPEQRHRIAPHPHVPLAIMLHGSGPHDVDARSAASKEVWVSRKAGEAVLRGAQVFVPGVLACSVGVCAGDDVVVWAVLEPPGSTRAGITRGTVLPLAAGNGEACIHACTARDGGSGGGAAAAALGQRTVLLGVGRTTLGRAEMFRAQHGVAVAMQQRVYDVPPVDLSGAREIHSNQSIMPETPAHPLMMDACVTMTLCDSVL